eukprot:TRINITY_DN3820_c0_g1_i2.p2 TRINITY_DN3820_c0_g1~~TRINITY_DN3820_c0_g1_i2.p2  ORF type:complete len:107 (-),score=13.79 TRINITY_DN3820_c0_g1_i2:787-1107(-)
MEDTVDAACDHEPVPPVPATIAEESEVDPEPDLAEESEVDPDLALAEESGVDPDPDPESDPEFKVTLMKEVSTLSLRTTTTDNTTEGVHAHCLMKQRKSWPKLGLG